MNPWTDSFEQYRQGILGEDKKKSDKQTKQRWQDDDCDDKWYEKSDVDGKISDREKKEKKKHYAKEDIADIIARLEKKRISKGGDPKESPLPSMRKYHADKKKKKKVKEEVVQEADSLSAQVGRWEAARQKRMKQRQSYERPHWIPRDQDHEDNYGSSKGEKKKKVKEDITLTRGDYASRNSVGSAWHTAAKRNFKGYKAGGGLTPQFKLADDVQIDHIDGSTTQIIDVVRRPAMVAAPKLSNWKEDMHWEALKGEKLDIDGEKGKVKNHVEINPSVKTEEKKKLTERDVYIKSWNRNPETGLPDYKQDKKPKEVKSAKPVAVDKASYEPEGEVISELDNAGGPAAIGAIFTAGAGLAKYGFDAVKNIRTKLQNKQSEKSKQYNRILNQETEPEGDVIENLSFTIGGGSSSTNRKQHKINKAADGGVANAANFAKGALLPNIKLANSYDPEGELVDEKVATGPRLGEPREKGAKHPNAGEGKKIQNRTLKWMRDRGKPGSPGLKDMTDRYKEHEDRQKKSRAKKKVEEHHKKPGEEHPIDEATKYSKVKGKNYKTGRKSVKGGTAKDDAVYKSVLANIIKQVGAGGVQQSSKQSKKKKGEKGRKQIGDRKFSPAETIRRRKASAKAAYKAMTDTRGT